MSKPKFTNSDSSTTITFERGRSFPATDNIEPNQITNESGAGYVQVITNGMAKRYLQCNFGHLSESQMTNLYAFLSDAKVNYKAHTFTFTDENGTDHTVRYWSDNFSRDTEHSLMQSVEILLKVEEE